MNFSKISQLNLINKDIFDIFKFFLFDDLKIFQKKEKENSINFCNFDNDNDNKENLDLSKAFCEFIFNENFEIFENFLKFFEEKFGFFLKGNLLFINLIAPKNNSIFKHKVKNEILPFFLEVKLRVSKIEYTENTFIELLNNLEIVIVDINTEGDYKYKALPLSFSNTKIRKNEFDKYYFYLLYNKFYRSILIKVKCSIYLEVNNNIDNKKDNYFSGFNNKNNKNYEIYVKMKHRYFEDFYTYILNKSKEELSLGDKDIFIDYKLEDDLILTNKIMFSINNS